MDTFFGIPTGRLALGALGLVALASAVLGVRAWRWPVFFWLGVRQLPRRPAQTALIVAGLTLSSALITASLTTGDTLTHALRSAAVAEIGALDELVTRVETPRPGAPPVFTGGNPLTPATFFSEDVYQRLAGRVGAGATPDADVQGLAPAIRLGCTIVDATSRQTSIASVLALPSSYDRAFGPLIAAGGPAGSATGSSGSSLELRWLTPSEAYVNDAGATTLAARPGDELSCTLAGVPHRWTVAGVAAPGGLGSGNTVVLFVQLEHLRASLAGSDLLTGIDRPINQVLVANRGNLLSSAARTDAVVRRLREALVDEGGLRTDRDVINRDDVRAAVAARRTALNPRTDAAIVATLAAASEPDEARSTERLGRVLQNDTVRTTLLAAARDVPDEAVAQRLSDAFRSALGYRVLPVKEQVLAFADRAGNIITTIFLLFSLLSMAAGVLLVFLIFSLLAAARRSELGITRALGAERGHLVAMFTYEGAAYAALATAAGVPLGLGVSRSLVELLLYAVQSGAAGFTGAAVRIAETVRWHAEPRSVALAAAVGLLLTLATVSAAAWRVSRLTIVSAIRDLPEPPAARRSITAWWWLGLLLVAAALLAAGLWWGQAFPFGAGVSAALVAAGGAVRHLGRGALGRSGAARAGATLAGAGLAAYWSLPFDAQHSMGLPRLSAGIELFALAGVLMVAGAIWALAVNGDSAARVLAWALHRMGRALPALRLAAAHTLRQPVRTGMTAAMFSLVVLMLTVMQVITAAAVRFHGDPAVVYGGWQIEGQVRAALPAPEGVAGATPSEADVAVGTETGQQQSQPFATDAGGAVAAASAGTARSVDAARVASAAAIQPGTKDLVSGAGLRTTALFAVLQLDAPSPAWGGYPVAGIDSAFAAANALPLQARADGYATDRDVWRAVASGTGLAVIDAQSFPSPQLRATSNVNVLSFTLRGLTHGTTRFAPLPVWVGNPSGKTVTRVQVIGIVDARVASAFRGLHVSLAQLEALGPPVRPPTTRLYFQVRDGADVTAARTALGETFFESGLETVSLLDRFVNENGPLVLASRLLQLFVGLGLGAGVAGLAVISMRAALERRHLIGILRAIGYPRATIQASLLLEAALVVLIGSGLGVALGLVLCRNIFAVQFFDRFQQGMRLVVPWDQLAVTVLATALAAVAATWAPAWQAARIPPVAAIREG